MAAEITAWFENVDQAENAARELRRRARGIRSLRIRQPRPRPEPDPSVPLQALALYGAPTAQTAAGGSAPYAPQGFFPGALEDALSEPLLDGPAGRTDALMIIRAEEGSARQTAAVLTALHARNVRVTPGLPR